MPSARPACLDHSSLFQNSLVENPPASSAPAALRARAAQLAERAAEVCSVCPLQRQCLYESVVNHDVSGIVGGTTEAQRQLLRRRLRVRLDSENLDDAAGVLQAGRQLDSAEVARLRRANPDESLRQLAMRLGCSLSTVKRHLRRTRDLGSMPVEVGESLPSVERVWAAARGMLGRQPQAA